MADRVAALAAFAGEYDVADLVVEEPTGRYAVLCARKSGDELIPDGFSFADNPTDAAMDLHAVYRDDVRALRMVDLDTGETLEILEEVTISISDADGTEIARVGEAEWNARHGA